MPSVTIDRRFFQNVKTDYSDWVAAFAREALQNCIDYGRTQITVDVNLTPECNTEVFFFNDGKAMTVDELENKLLSLGATGKDFQGTIGGFGRAKELLYFTHLNYGIETYQNGTEHLVSGSGGSYSLSTYATAKQGSGTRSRVLIEGNYADQLVKHFLAIAATSKFRQQLTVRQDGVALAVPSCLNKGRYRRDFSFGKIYTNKQFDNILIVRIGGLAMFSHHISYPNTVVLELEGSSADLLTSNRDGLKWNYRREVESFIESLSQNRRKAFRQQRPKFERYYSYKLSTRGQTHAVPEFLASVAGSFHSPAVTAPKLEIVVSEDGAGGEVSEGDVEETRNRLIEEAEDKGYFEVEIKGFVPEARRGLSAPSQPTVQPPRKVRLGFDFILQNDIDRNIPKRYRPETFSQYSAKLAAVWAKLLVEVHLLLKIEAEFSVGFQVVEKDAEGYSLASCSEMESIGKVYFITPAVYDSESTKVQKYSNIWNISKAEDRMHLISCAVHEVTHGEGYMDHTEAFANAYTANMAKVLPHVNRLKKAFKIEKVEVNA